MRSLRHLTSTHQICTLLLNSAVATNPSESTSFSNRIDDSNNVSIFEAIAGKPALGKTYAHLLDTSLLLSIGPSHDEVVDGGEGMVVLEALYDRFGVRRGRWVGLHVSVSGLGDGVWGS